jgi:hypothetical protein
VTAAQGTQGDRTPAHELRVTTVAARDPPGTTHAVPDGMLIVVLAVLAWWLAVPPMSVPSLLRTEHHPMIRSAAAQLPNRVERRLPVLRAAWSASSSHSSQPANGGLETACR